MSQKSSLIPKGRTLQLSLRLVVPETVTSEELMDWINMEICQSGSISLENPLSTHSPEPEIEGVSDTGCYRVTEITDIRRDCSGISYKVHRHEEGDRRTDVEIGRWESGQQILDKALDEFRKENPDG